jgi:hypothetical protein
VVQEHPGGEGRVNNSRDSGRWEMERQQTEDDQMLASRAGCCARQLERQQQLLERSPGVLFQAGDHVMSHDAYVRVSAGLAHGKYDL